MKKANAASVLGILALIASAIGVATVVVTTSLARWDVTEKISSVGGVMSGGQILLVGLAVSIIALIFGLVTRSGWLKSAVLGLVLSGGMLAYLASQVVPGMGAPPLHDITTDLDNTPEYQALTLREDNLIPFENLDGWREAHRAGYPDIAPIIIAASPEDVITKAMELSEARGWTMAAGDPAAGRMEATAYASWIKFRDDVIIRATALEDGTTRVDMRSTSQVGMGDLGFNAKRVKEFLGALEGAFAS